MKFADIPQMSRPGYSCDHLLYMLPEAIRSYQEEQLAPLDMEPDFQRVHVWTPGQQTRYMEFILRGGNSSRDIYFNCPGWMGAFKGPFELVDGKQRLAACLGFMAGTVPVFDGLRIGDFTDKPPATPRSASTSTTWRLGERSSNGIWTSTPAEWSTPLMNSRRSGGF